MNLPTLIILIVIAVAFVTVLCILIRRRRRCAPGCANCPFADDCSRKH